MTGIDVCCKRFSPAKWRLHCPNVRRTLNLSVYRINDFIFPIIITPMQPAFFLDRDGVIIAYRKNYVLAWEQVAFIPRALAALQRLRETPYQVYIVTNQSPIGRGLLTWAQVETINQRLLAQVTAAGGRVDGVYVCPHHPKAGCACRKPEPGLILQAASDHDLDLGRSLIIGDALSDLQAGFAAGVGGAALVRTGRGAQQAQDAAAARMPPFPVYDDLYQALEDLIWRTD